MLSNKRWFLNRRLPRSHTDYKWVLFPFCQIEYNIFPKWLKIIIVQVNYFFILVVRTSNSGLLLLLLLIIKLGRIHLILSVLLLLEQLLPVNGAQRGLFLAIIFHDGWRRLIKERDHLSFLRIPLSQRQQWLFNFVGELSQWSLAFRWHFLNGEFLFLR